MKKASIYMLLEESSKVRERVRDIIKESRHSAQISGALKPSGSGLGPFQYRLSLIGSNGRNHGSAQFKASSDEEAKQIAGVVCSATAGDFLGFEVYRDDIRILNASSGYLRATAILETINEAQQQIASDLEEAMQSSSECIARSQKILAATVVS
jgi:hypothetical protein